MNRSLSRTILSVVVVVVAGCSSSSSSSSTTAPTTTLGGSVTTAGSPATTVGLASDPALGQILVDSKGITLYRNTKEKGTTIVCTGACASVWPPLTVAAGTSPTGAAGLPGTLGTVTRPDGTVQVTYRNWPLYRYAKDSKAGDTTGQGVGGVWYVVTASGAANGSTATTPAPAGTAPAGTAPSATTTTAYGY